MQWILLPVQRALPCMERAVNAVMPSHSLTAILAPQVATFLEQPVLSAIQRTGSVLLDMAWQLLGAGEGLGPIGTVEAVAPFQIPRAH